jgi:hypothetical protein
MTYARARLWLGVTGVGSLVTICSIAWVLGLPHALLSTNEVFGISEILQIAAVTGAFLVWQAPLDFLGGYWLPQRFQKSKQNLGHWFRGYLVAALSQALLFIAFGSLILLLGQRYGSLGGLATISLFIVACFIIRNRLLLNRTTTSKESSEKLVDAIAMIQSWEIFVPRTVVVKHQDIGFTGGIVGLGKHAQIVIPKAWLSFGREQLATAIARRAIAINSGSYTRGLAVAFGWNVAGFLLCSLIPAAGLTSVAGLMTTVCAFTIWSFLGLLTLPTVSRNASLNIDQALVQQGMPAELIQAAAFTMDQMQDGEPERSAWVETIFHPVPNVTSRNPNEPIRGLAAWNVARTTLFFSWACLGFLSRSVHCNVGRPELWTMLPTD